MVKCPFADVCKNSSALHTLSCYPEAACVRTLMKTTWFVGIPRLHIWGHAYEISLLCVANGSGTEIHCQGDSFTSESVCVRKYFAYLPSLLPPPPPALSFWLCALPLVPWILSPIGAHRCFREEPVWSKLLFCATQAHGSVRTRIHPFIHLLILASLCAIFCISQAFVFLPDKTKEAILWLIIRPILIWTFYAKAEQDEVHSL